MHLKIIKILSWSVFLITLTASAGTSHPSDPSVPDETDLSVIDDFLKAASVNKASNNTTPNRGSLPEPSKEAAITATTATSVTPANLPEGQCKCVKYYLCDMKIDSSQNNGTNSSGHDMLPPQNQTVSPQDGSNGTAKGQEIFGVVDVRKAELQNLQGNSTMNKNETSQCESYFDVCCPPTQIKEYNETQQDVNGEKPKPVSAPADNHNGTHTRCGRRNEKGVGFTMTGATQSEAQFGEFPWSIALVQLEASEDNPNVSIHKYVGGGSLLHPQVVLTAAHNVLGKSRTTLKVRLGEWDTQTNDEPYPSQDRHVKKSIIHEQFVLKTLFNDVALLILDEEARFAPNVDTVCLPPLNKTMNFEGQLCYSAGWGKDHFGAEGRYSEIMKRVTVPVISKSKCQEELSKSEKLPGFRLDKSFMCAGGNDSDTCKGDGGAALVCSTSGNYVQVGAVSWGIGCGTQFPGVYSDITLLTPWILKQMANEGMSSEYCTIHD